MEGTQHSGAAIDDDDGSIPGIAGSSTVDGTIQIALGSAAKIGKVGVNRDILFDSNTRALGTTYNDIGGNLQAFQYTGGVTNSFNTIDGNLQCKENQPAPTGRGVTSSSFNCRYSVFFWHLLLSEQMTKEVPGIPPTVTAIETGTSPDEYLRFRHVVRNLYAHHFNPAKAGKRVNSAPELFARAKAELLAFAAVLEH